MRDLKLAFLLLFTASSSFLSLCFYDSIGKGAKAAPQVVFSTKASLQHTTEPDVAVRSKPIRSTQSDMDGS